MFVPVVISISLVTLIVWLLLGKEFAYALARGISVLVISCPCALGLATPVAIMVGNGLGAKNGILFKTAVSLEETGKVQIVALDKTGTITNGTPKVTDIVPAEGISESELLSLAFALEAKFPLSLEKSLSVLRIGKRQHLLPRVERHHFCLQKTSSFWVSLLLPTRSKRIAQEQSKSFKIWAFAWSC